MDLRVKINMQIDLEGVFKKHLVPSILILEKNRAYSSKPELLLIREELCRSGVETTWRPLSQQKIGHQTPLISTLLLH